MKAFGVGASSDRGYVSDWDCDLRLPGVQCEACGESYLDGDVWYPSARLKAGTSPDAFADGTEIGVKAFRSLIKSIQGPWERPPAFCPGAGLGSVRAAVSGTGVDFRWCEGKPLVSRRVVERLQGEGFEVRTGPVIGAKGQVVDGYLAWEVPVVAVYAKATTDRLGLLACEACGGWRLQDIRVSMRGPRDYMGASMPPDAALVKAAEGGETLAAGRFMELARKEKWSGIEFRERGLFV